MKLRKLALADLGSESLPIPQPEIDSIQFLPYTMGRERELGDIRHKHPSWSFFQYMTEVLIHMAELGSDWSNLSKEERLGRVNRLWFPNAIYIYTLLRIDALGPEGAIPVICPVCRNQWDFTYNLNESPVAVVEDPDDISWTVDLLDGFQWGDQQIKTLTLKVPQWQAVAGIRRVANEVTLEMELLRSYIVPPEKYGPPTLQVLENVTRKDMLIIARSMEEHTVGIDFSVHTTCPADGAPIDVVIDWGVDSFFGNSFRPTR